MNCTINECPNATLHGTKVTEMNLVRKELWEVLGSYENIKLSSDIIKKIIDTNFNKSSDYICYINLPNRNINITNSKILPNSEVECMIWVSMVNILNELHDRNIISDIMFNKCISYPSLLYSIIVNHNGTIGIQL